MVFLTFKNKEKNLVYQPSWNKFNSYSMCFKIKEQVCFLLLSLLCKISGWIEESTTDQANVHQFLMKFISIVSKDSGGERRA